MSERTTGGVLRRVINYRWTRSKGLECEMFPGVWTRSNYTLPELLAGMNGPFKEDLKS